MTVEVLNDKSKAPKNKRKKKRDERLVESSKKIRMRGYKPYAVEDLVQTDALIELKKYIITAVDLVTKFAFAYCYLSLRSKKGYNFGRIS